MKIHTYVAYWSFLVALTVLAPGCNDSDESDASADYDRPPTAIDFCFNGLKDHFETGVDCGGPCAPCKLAFACVDDNDCLSHACGVSYLCIASQCGNGVQDGGEAGVDCGGDCKRCEGAKCTSNADCVSGACKAGHCGVASCVDGEKNGSETDVDCGGSCAARCDEGKGCVTDVGCLSGYCDDEQHCGEVTCDDRLKTANESDVDCGGACKPCADGLRCLFADDCVSGTCLRGRCITLAPHCDNGKRDEDETDIDCGGSCALCPFAAACVSSQDCASDECGEGDKKTCVAPPTCSDGVPSGSESDVDCGSAVCTPCPPGKLCKGPLDCIDRGCVTEMCKVPRCDDHVRDGDETDVDCGGRCQTCPSAKRCIDGTDCESKGCTNAKCTSLAPHCDDGLKDSDETDVDCGGSCALCPFAKACEKPDDCASADCANAQCAAPETCSDKALSGAESDVDCGSAVCDACPIGDDCQGPVDCGDNGCVVGTCKVPRCDDKVQDGDETDVDCGGTCPSCPSERTCQDSGDCQSKTCEFGACTALLPTCENGKKDGSETDIDCGGKCAACRFEAVCTKQSDCASNLCGEEKHCEAPESCTDGAKNGSERDVDCGGEVCPQCPIGKNCEARTDCVDNGCVGGTCQTPTCADGVDDGKETDVDCGGPCTTKCPNDAHCLEDLDCGESKCGTALGVCCKTNVCGLCGPVTAEKCNGLDDDCNMQTDDNLKFELCGNQQGVCQGRRQECSGGGMKCPTPPFPYQAVETYCDHLDNDCDGEIDEDGCELCLGGVADFDATANGDLTNINVGTEFFTLNGGTPTAGLSGYDAGTDTWRGYLARNTGAVPTVVSEGIVGPPALAFTGTSLVAAYRKESPAPVELRVVDVTDEPVLWHVRKTGLAPAPNLTGGLVPKPSTVAYASGAHKQVVVYQNAAGGTSYDSAGALGAGQTWATGTLDTAFDSDVTVKITLDDVAHFVWHVGGEGGDLVISDGIAAHQRTITTATTEAPDMAVAYDTPAGVVFVVYRETIAAKVFLATIISDAKPIVFLEIADQISEGTVAVAVDAAGVPYVAYIVDPTDVTPASVNVVRVVDGAVQPVVTRTMSTSETAHIDGLEIEVVAPHNLIHIATFIRDLNDRQLAFTTTCKGYYEDACNPSCTGIECGPSNCPEVSCGGCIGGLECSTTGKCVEPCTPNCVDRDCGDDGCGEPCGVCATGVECSAEGVCGGPDKFGLPTGCITSSDTSQCNPLSNAECKASGSICDFKPTGVTTCFAASSDTAGPGKACNATSGPFCGAGYHCDAKSKSCRKFCCSKTDCGQKACSPIDSSFGLIGTCPP